MEQHAAMTNLPNAADPTRPTAAGILHCLRMLAEEAAALNLAGTLDALRVAMVVCAAEIDRAAPRTGGAVLLH
jgi:hypothetical protein